MVDNKDGPSWDDLRSEAVSLASAASGRALVLRLVGSAGVRLCSTEAERLLSALRPPPKDLDFVCRSQDRSGLKTLFVEHGYEVDRDMLVAMEGMRYAFRNATTGLKIDLFVDRLDFCHRIDLGDRIAAPGLTIPREALLLHKLQIVSLTSGDLLDLGVLLHLFDFEPGDTGFNLEQLLNPLAADWGFCHTVERNLSRIAEHAGGGGYAALGADAGSRIAARAATFARTISAAPKSMRWKLRARIGERIQWWQDVDDREGTY